MDFHNFCVENCRRLLPLTTEWQSHELLPLLQSRELLPLLQVNIIRDSSGRGRGFGFVTMANDDEAVKAVLKLNRSMFTERLIEVRFKLKVCIVRLVRSVDQWRLL